jgi:hypothetical protein
MHFTPTSSSWLNMVERFFRDLTQNRLRRGVFRDVEELITAIGDYIDHHNQSPKPFIWTARAADILEKVKRARHTLHKRNLNDALHSLDSAAARPASDNCNQFGDYCGGPGCDVGHI